MRAIKKISWHQKILLKKELKIKCKLFKRLGYQSVDEAELINYVLDYRWKKNAPKTLSGCRKDILAISPNDFFDYQQLRAQTSQFKINDPLNNLDDLF